MISVSETFGQGTHLREALGALPLKWSAFNRYRQAGRSSRRGDHAEAPSKAKP